MARAHSRCSSTFLLHETNAKEIFNWRKASEFHRMCKCSLNAIPRSFSHVVSLLTESKICYSVFPVRSTYVYALIFFQGCVLYLLWCNWDAGHFRRQTSFPLNYLPPPLFVSRFKIHRVETCSCHGELHWCDAGTFDSDTSWVHSQDDVMFCLFLLFFSGTWIPLSEQ